MKLKQLLYFHEVIKQDFDIPAASQTLDTSPSGLARQLEGLAGELGVALFLYQGERLTGLTDTGREIAELAASILRDIKRIRRVADASIARERGGLLVVATRHVSAERLRDAMTALRQQLPELRLRVCEEEPATAASMLLAGDADLGVLPESTEPDPELLYFPIEEWSLTLVAPRGHELCELAEVSLEDLTEEPLCSYERTAASRRIIDEAFRRQGLESPVTFSLGSSAMILEYVESGAGIGIIGESAFEPTDHPGLQGIPASHLFRPLRTELVLPRKARLPDFVYRFARLLAPKLTRPMIEEARRAEPA